MGWAAATGLLHLVVIGVLLAPLIWWRSRRGGYPMLAPSGGRSLLATAVVYLLAHVVLSLPRAGVFAELSYNWQNKLLLFGLLVLTVRWWPSLSRHELGIRRPRRGWWIPVLVVFGVMLGLNLVGEALMEPDAEALLYQAIVPGLDEELLFRGLLLVLVRRSLMGHRPMWRAEVGWEVPITCLLFGLAHGLSVGSGGQVDVDPGQVVFTGLVGLMLVWIRLRWASLWPAVLAHNAFNSSVTVANAL